MDSVEWPGNAVGRIPTFGGGRAAFFREEEKGKRGVRQKGQGQHNFSSSWKSNAPVEPVHEEGNGRRRAQSFYGGREEQQPETSEQRQRPSLPFGRRNAERCEEIGGPSRSHRISRNGNALPRSECLSSQFLSSAVRNHMLKKPSLWTIFPRFLYMFVFGSTMHFIDLDKSLVCCLKLHAVKKPSLWTVFPRFLYIFVFGSAMHLIELDNWCRGQLRAREISFRGTL